MEPDDGNRPEVKQVVGAENTLVVDVQVEPLDERRPPDPRVTLVGCQDEEVGAVVTELSQRRAEPEGAGVAVVGAKEYRDAPVREREDDPDARPSRAG